MHRFPLAGAQKELGEALKAIKDGRSLAASRRIWKAKGLIRQGMCHRVDRQEVPPAQ